MNFKNLNLLKQIKSSFLYKIFAVIFSFVLIRLMVQYLGIEQYGIWSVLLTFINFVLFFDLGITNGIKNKVSISLSNNNKLEAQEYVSTGYIILFILTSFIYIIYYICSFYIDWQSVFNTSIVENDTLRQVVSISLFFILLNFVLSVISALYNATQNASFIVLNQLLTQFISLSLVSILFLFTKENIVYIAISYGISLILSNSLLSIYFYSKHTYLLPKIKLFKIDKIKSILTLGIKFFILQLTIFIILSTDKILITQLLGTSYVTSYDILYKYFSIITITHGIINTPLWSMYTEAYEKNDYIWIEQILKKMVGMMLIYMSISFILYIAADGFIPMWIANNDLILNSSNYIFMSILILFLVWYSIFAYFTNGINKTKIQLYSALLGAVINIPLAILFVKYLNMELNGILLSTIISLSIFGITGPIQAYKEIKLMKQYEKELKS